jgi:hypothetical protein
MGSSAVGLGLGWPTLRLGLALFDAGGAGTGQTQPGKTPGTLVAVDPIDLHAFALSDEHTDLFRGDADAGQRTLCLALASFVFLGRDADAFVAHKYSLQ